jgi:hypothetical protein
MMAGGFPQRGFQGRGAGNSGHARGAELVKERLDIQSKRGRGTRVTEYLPLSPKGGRHD